MEQQSPTSTVTEASHINDEPLRVATYNMENVRSASTSHFDDYKLHNLAQSIVNELHMPHIIAAQEIQANDTDKSAEDVLSDITSTDLLSYIAFYEAKNGSPTKTHYRYVDIAPEYNADGGERNCNIRNGFIYDASRVTLHAASRGDATTKVQFSHGEDGNIHLCQNPGRIAPNDAVFNNSRKPLVAEFIDRDTGESIFVVNVHFISKRKKPDATKEEVDAIRQAQATRVGEFVQSLQEALQDNGQQVHILVMGDFNAYSYEKEHEILRDYGLVDCAWEGKQNDLHSILYNDETTTCDYILATPVMAEKLGKIYMPDLHSHDRIHRSSDHNPIIAEFCMDSSNNKRTLLTAQATSQIAI